MPWSYFVPQLVALWTSGAKMCKLREGIVGIGFLFLICAQCTHAQWTHICADEEDGTRLPLPLDCARFAVCEDREVAQIRRCPRGLHFNAHLGECDFQWRAECYAAALFGKTVRDNECVCTCCAEECPDDGDKPDQTTPCLPIESSTSTPRPGTTETEVTSTEPTETTNDGDSTSETDTTEYPSVPTSFTPGWELPSFCVDTRTDCVNQPDGAMLQIKGICTNFIQCSHGCSVEQTCPSGLYFDPVLNLCNSPWLVDCEPVGPDDNDGEIVGPSGTSCSDQSVCAGQRDGKMFADPDSNGYFVCQCQCPVAMTCDPNTKFNQTAQVCDWDRPQTGTSAQTAAVRSSVICPGDLVYNATSDQCDYPAGYVPEVVCANPSTICQGQPEGKLFPIDGVCNMFYKCNYNCAVEQYCPNNLLYDSETKICDFPENVDCPWEYKPPTGPNAGPSGIACESNGRCLGQRDGVIFPSQTSCSGYVICQCECEVPMECPEGLRWDAELSTCNYADRVSCSL